MQIPDELSKLTAKPDLNTVRYEVAIGFDKTQLQFEIKAETLLLKKPKAVEVTQHTLFPAPPTAPDSILT